MSESEWYKRYKWCEPIAQGGMGDVYYAEDRENGFAPCVIKQLRSESQSLEEREEAKRLFLREAKMLRDYDHPGIVRFFDSFVSDGGKYFLVMDYIKGNNLETCIQNYGAFSQEDIIKIGVLICEVLEFLHEQTPPVIYRDLKPSNLMLTPEGQIVFIDFGIAKVFMPKENQTRVVTAGYSPPEQYFGKPETRSDLYSFGATMFHLLTGIRPRPLTPSIPSQKVEGILPTLDDLIRRCTSHSLDDRPNTAREIRHTLFKIYQEIDPALNIPEEINDRDEEQFISQRILQTGLTAASSLSQELPAAKGAESEVFSDDNMPSAVRGIIDGLSQRLSSSKLSTYDSDTEPSVDVVRQDETPAKRTAKRVNRKSRKSIETQVRKETGIMDKLFGWIKKD